MTAPFHGDGAGGAAANAASAPHETRRRVSAVASAPTPSSPLASPHPSTWPCAAAVPRAAATSRLRAHATPCSPPRLPQPQAARGSGLHPYAHAMKRTAAHRSGNAAAPPLPPGRGGPPPPHQRASARGHPHTAAAAAATRARKGGCEAIAGEETEWKRLCRLPLGVRWKPRRGWPSRSHHAALSPPFPARPSDRPQLSSPHPPLQPCPPLSRRSWRRNHQRSVPAQRSLSIPPQTASPPSPPSASRCPRGPPSHRQAGLAPGGEYPQRVCAAPARSAAIEQHLTRPLTELSLVFPDDHWIFPDAWGGVANVRRWAPPRLRRLHLGNMHTGGATVLQSLAWASLVELFLHAAVGLVDDGGDLCARCPALAECQRVIAIWCGNGRSGKDLRVGPARGAGVAETQTAPAAGHGTVKGATGRRE